MYFVRWDTFVRTKVKEQENNLQDLFLPYCHICSGDFNFLSLGLVESSISLEKTTPLPKCDPGYSQYPGNSAHPFRPCRSRQRRNLQSWAVLFALIQEPYPMSLLIFKSNQQLDPFVFWNSLKQDCCHMFLYLQIPQDPGRSWFCYFSW